MTCGDENAADVTVLCYGLPILFVASTIPKNKVKTPAYFCAGVLILLTIRAKQKLFMGEKSLIAPVKAAT
jgi:hypothetical protein